MRKTAAASAVDAMHVCRHLLHDRKYLWDAMYCKSDSAGKGAGRMCRPLGGWQSVMGNGWGPVKCAGQ